MMGLSNYLAGVVIEGVMIGVIFWVITFITMESNSLLVAVRSSLIAELIGNIPYLWEIPPLDPISLVMTLVAAVVLVRLVIRAGELTLGKVIYGTSMTYFILVAIVTCSN